MAVQVAAAGRTAQAGAQAVQGAGQAMPNPYAAPAQSFQAAPDPQAAVPGAPNASRMNPRATGWRYLEEEAERGNPIVNGKMLARMKKFEGVISSQSAEAAQNNAQKEEQKQGRQPGLRSAAGEFANSIANMHHQPFI